MGKQFTVAKGFVDVRYSVTNPKVYNAGDTVTLTDADYAALPASLTRTISGSVTTVADPVYAPYPFLSTEGLPVFLVWNGSDYTPTDMKSVTDRPKIFIGPTDPNGFNGVVLAVHDSWDQTTA